MTGFERWYFFVVGFAFSLTTGVVFVSLGLGAGEEQPAITTRMQTRQDVMICLYKPANERKLNIALDYKIFIFIIY